MYRTAFFVEHHHRSRLNRFSFGDVEFFRTICIGQSNVASYFHVTLEKPCESASFTNHPNSRCTPALDAVTFVTYPENPQLCVAFACHTKSIGAYPTYSRASLGNTL